MAQNFIACDREQPFLLPPDVREWLPEDHLAWFVIDAVGVMDLGAFYAAYRRGRSRSGGLRAGGDGRAVAVLLGARDSVGAGDRAGVRGGRRVPRDRCPAAARSRDDRSLRRASRTRAGRAVRRGARLVRRRRVGECRGDRHRRHQGRGQRQPRPDDGLRAARQDDRRKRQISTDAAEDELYGQGRGEELPPELAQSKGRQVWLREAKRRLDERRAEEAKPIPRSRPERLKDAKRRLDEELWTEQRANEAYEAYRARGVGRTGRRFSPPRRPSPTRRPRPRRARSTSPISTRGWSRACAAGSRATTRRRSATSST